jgi:hypothetical protein
MSLQSHIMAVLENNLDVSFLGELNIYVNKSNEFIVELYDPIDKNGKVYFSQWGEGPNGKSLERKTISNDWREKKFDTAEEAIDFFIAIKQELKFDECQ